MVVLGLLLLLAAPAGADQVAEPADLVVRLDVQFLHQTEALCGGAAAAMIFRYWGHRHANAQQFESLIDRRAGGIADDVLVDAIRQRRWQAVRLTGTLEVLRAHLAGGQPLMLLIEDRPGRYHYVVAVGMDADHVYLHDPAWGPTRRYTTASLLRVWAPSNFWTLLVVPSGPLSTVAVAPESSSPSTSVTSSQLPDSGGACALLLTDAVAEIRTRGLAAADEVLGDVRRRCPTASEPISELAGVRFAQLRWREAASLAEEALELDERDHYAWDVLGSSRFVQDDLHGALAAWNRIGKPRLDSVRIEGLTRTRYALAAEALGLDASAVITPASYLFAERRLQQLPNGLSTRLGYRPDADGFATVEVSILERAFGPRSAFDWIAEGARTLGTREVRAALPGHAGQGEVWTASWRWWRGRPRVAGNLAFPTLGALAGVWRIEAAWEAQSFAPAPDRPVIREERLGGELSVTDWLTSNLRYDLSVGIDSWGGIRQTVSLGGALERRLLKDRLSLSASARAWMPISSSRGFRSTGVHALFRTSTRVTGVVHLANAGIERVTSAAPLGVWPGADTGRTRLARAHPLRNNGLIDGAMFGRHLAYFSLETRRWFERPTLVRWGVAGFLDAAYASERLEFAVGKPLQVDAGAGLRLKVPGHDGTLRVDFRRGLREARNGLTFGWQF